MTSSPPGINCPAISCSGVFTGSTTVTLLANITSGSTFAGWGGDCAGQGNPCLVLMSGPKSATATFTLTSGTITGLTATPSPAQVGQAVSITISGTGPCGGLALAFGDGGSTGLTGSLPLITTHTYASAGQFTLTATGVNNCAGSASTSLTVNNLTGTLTVAVQRSDTRIPLQGATVTLTQGPSNPPSQITGSDGIATFSNVVAGTYLATATLAGFQTNNATAVVNANTTTPAFILLTPIQSTGTLAVTVRRSDTSAALQGATVALSGGPSNPAPQTTGSDGTAIFTNIAVGSYTATASLAGFQTNSATTTVGANTTSQVSIALTPTPQETKRVVILVHGIMGDPTAFGDMASLLEQTGKFKVFSFDYSAFSKLDRSDLFNPDRTMLNFPIEQIAIALKLKCIDNVLKHRKKCTKADGDPKNEGDIPNDQPIDTSSVDIVAHSMGGLVTLAYISGLAGTQYENDIGKFVTLGTPFFGSFFGSIFETKGIVNFPRRQVDEMAFASEFLWKLQQAWKDSDFAKNKKADILTIVGTLDVTSFGGDGVVPIASAALSDLGIRARYVPKCHTNAPILAAFGCSDTNAIARVFLSHPSYLLVRSFLLDGRDPADCPSSVCGTTPPSTTGDLFVGFVEKSDPTIPVPVRFELDAVDPLVTLGPPDVTPPLTSRHHGRQAGTLFITDLPSGSYPLSIHGSRFNLVTPKYKDRALPTTLITAGRTTLLSPQPLEREGDIYTVSLLRVNKYSGISPRVCYPAGERRAGWHPQRNIAISRPWNAGVWPGPRCCDRAYRRRRWHAGSASRANP